MAGRIIFEEDLETKVAELIKKYPTGFLSEIEVGWPCAIAIRVPEGGCLDTPRAIIRGSYQEVRAFEIAYESVKRATKRVALSLELITGIRDIVEA